VLYQQRPPPLRLGLELTQASMEVIYTFTYSSILLYIHIFTSVRQMLNVRLGCRKAIPHSKNLARRCVIIKENGSAHNLYRKNEKLHQNANKRKELLFSSESRGRRNQNPRQSRSAARSEKTHACHLRSERLKRLKGNLSLGCRFITFCHIAKVSASLINPFISA